MATTTANGLTATALRGIPNTWIVRRSKFTYWAIRTDGTHISSIDTGKMQKGDYAWEIIGSAHLTHAIDYDTPGLGRMLAGWYCEFRGNAGEPYRRGADALSALKLLIRNNHNVRKA